MKTTGTISHAVRKAGRMFLRRFPRLRWNARKVYWGIQRRRYEHEAAKQPIDAHRVFFESFGGRSVCDSPKALLLAMLRDRKYEGYSFVLSLSRPDEKQDVLDGIFGDDMNRIDVVRHGSLEYFKELMRCGTIVINTRLPEYVYPRTGNAVVYVNGTPCDVQVKQTYVSCWHGTPLKRLGYDVDIDMHNTFNTTAELAWRFGIDSEKWTYLLSPSAYTTEHLCSAFGLPREKWDDVVLEVGYPRNDAISTDVEWDDEDVAKRRAAAVERLRDIYGIELPAGKKVLLYAPTWRDDLYVDGKGHVLDEGMLLDFSEVLREIGDEWCVMFRGHYYVADDFDFSRYGNQVIDASKVDDVNDCYLVADALCTDYSSVFYDYANLHRPIGLFVPDYDKYASEIRGFYTSLDVVPGPICDKTLGIIKMLSDIDGYWKKYGEKYDEFVKTYAPMDDGKASQRVLDIVFGK